MQNVNYSINDRAYQLFQIITDIRGHEGVQNLLGIWQFVFGIVAINNVFQEYVLKINIEEPPKKIDRAYKINQVIKTLGYISLIGTGASSRPAAYLWKWGAQKLLNPSQIQKLFGNERALKIQFIVSLSSFILGIPSTCRFIFKTCVSIKDMLTKNPEKKKKRSKIKQQHFLDAAQMAQTIVKGTLITGRLLGG